MNSKGHFSFGGLGRFVASRISRVLAAVGVGARDDGAMEPSKLSELGDLLERRLEQLQDSKWELSETTTRYLELLDAQNGFIIRRNGLGEITFANKAFCKAFGLEKAELLGSRFEPVIVKGDELDLSEGGEDLREGCQAQHVMTAKGPRWILWETHKLSSESGRVETQLIGHDITEQKASAAKLRHARDQAEQGSRAKSRFLAAMSHEIRTLMNGILGMAGLLRDTPLSSEQRAYSDAIEQSAQALLGLIDEVLDFSKIEAGKLALQDEPFCIESCLQSAVELLAPRAHEKGLQLAWQVGASCPAEFTGDEARVHQIVLNLLSNAIKFTDRGGVTVTAMRANANGRDVFRVEVVDTGIGLSDNDRGALFDEFEQCDEAIRRHSGGTGLGLAISKRLAVAMGGSLSVSSQLGAGSTFSLELPVGDQLELPSSVPGASTEDRVGAHRVLLASDRTLERGVLARILVEHDIAVVETDPSRAIGEIEAAASRNAPFDRIVVCGHCDLDLARQILDRARIANAGVAGLVCVDAMERQYLDSFEAAGFETHLIRPVRPKVLVREIFGPHGLVERKPAQRRDVKTGSIDGGAKDGPLNLPRARLILLAEDNPVNELLASRIIEKAGHSSISVRNGVEAVSYMRGALFDEKAMPDLILMDILMPELDGVKATEQIKALYLGLQGSTHRCPPIIALTAHAFEEDRQRYIEKGLDDYLSKPFEASELISLINAWCGVHPKNGLDRLPELNVPHSA